MSLLFLSGEPETEVNPHVVAWRSKDYEAVKKLSAEFKKPAEQCLFDILNNVTKKTGYLSAAHFEDYDQRAINNALSQHVTMRGYAYELNQMYGHITDQQHYDYLYHSIRQCSLPKVKFAKVQDDWESRVYERLVSKYFEVSTYRAYEYICFFSEEQNSALKNIVRTMVVDENSAFLSIIPTKAERLAVYNAIKKW